MTHADEPKISRVPNSAPGRRVGIRPAQYVVLSYLATVFLGAVLLKLPQASAMDRTLTWIEALFTSTSAICVTGLTVVSTAHDLTLFGQWVVLILIEVGALGVMTLSTFFLLLLGRRVRLQDRLFLQHDLNHGLLSGLVRLVRQVVGLALTIQAAGVLVLYLGLRGETAPGRALYLAVFHSVSAFGNAGFDLFGNSLEGMVNNYYVTGGVALLIIAGGIGFSVLADLRSLPRNRSLTLHSRVVLTITAGLLAVGTLVVLVLEWGNAATLGHLGFLNKVWHAFFLSTTARTAGFNTVPTGSLAETTLFILTFLMFIGASPGSTGGGVKTTTTATLLAAVRSSIRGYPDLKVSNRRLPRDAVSRAVTIVVTASLALGGAVFFLTLTETTPFLPTFFEAVSAFGTVGLSTGITSGLTSAGKSILIILMLIGRVGPMTFALALGGRQEKERYRLPEESLPLG